MNQYILAGNGVIGEATPFALAGDANVLLLRKRQLSMDQAKKPTRLDKFGPIHDDDPSPLIRQKSIVSTAMAAQGPQPSSRLVSSRLPDSPEIIWSTSMDVP